MENRRKFLSDLLGQDIYVIKDRVTDYSQQSENPIEVPLVEENKIEYTGSNSKGILVIIEENLSEEENSLLDNILKSVELSRQEIALVESGSNLGNMVEALENIPSSVLISFGVSSGKSRLLDIQTKYTPTTISGKKVIMAESLKLINEDKDLKRSLWNCLKEVF